MPGPSRKAASVPGAAALVDDYAAWLTETGRATSGSYVNAAWSFLVRWPEPQRFAAEPLEVRLAAKGSISVFLTFLMVWGHLRPGYDYLAHRKIQALRTLAGHSPLAADLSRFDQTAETLGFSPHQRHRIAERVLVRLLIQTGRPMAALDPGDLAALEAAFAERGTRRAQVTWKNDRTLLFGVRSVLYHLGVLDDPPSRSLLPLPERYAGRFDDVPDALRASFLTYLECLTATHAPSTVSGYATHLAHFGRFLGSLRAPPGSLADLNRRAHVEPYLVAVANARRTDSNRPVSREERRNRILTVSKFLADITEWGWAEAPKQRLLFSGDVPRRPRTLPRYLPLDADRRVCEALERSPNRLVADALLLARATGLRIGELRDLELDCVHEIPGEGAWLKVPLGKLDTERMVPLDEETVALIDRIAAHRSRGRPLPHPRSGQRCDFLLTHHGKRVSAHWLRKELARAGDVAGVGRAVPHQLRHTWATALVNSGCTLQALMALLGHTSAAMSLRYGRLFDATVRENYERALAQTRANLSPVLAPATPVELTTDWRQAPAIKARLAGGYCVRALAQGPCPYTHICEFCPNFRTDATFLPVLAAQRADTEALARDAELRGWGEEVARHRRSLQRLDRLIAQTQTG